MSRCHVCGKNETSQPVCIHCGKTYCRDHISRDNHPCFGNPGMGKKVYVGAWNDNLNPSYFEEDGFDEEMEEMMRKKEKLENPGVLNLFTSSPTLCIIVACILFFILINVFPKTLSYLVFIPNTTFIMYRPWTIITHMFLHGDFNHLLFNMLALYFFGTFLEKRIGKKLFVLVYFLSGLFAVFVYSLFSPNPVLGASGAIYGILATVAVLDPSLRVIVFIFPMKIVHAVILFAAIDLFSGIVLSGLSPVAHFAHLGGLFFGLIAGYFIKKKGLDRGRTRYW